jgi:hypothetical protein
MRSRGRFCFLLAAIAATHAGCETTTQLKQRRFVPIVPEATRIQTPTLNTPATAEVGETMILTGNISTRPAIILKAAVQHQGVSIGPYTITIPAGELVASGLAGPGDQFGTYYEAQSPLHFVSRGQRLLVKGGVFLPPSGGAPEIYWHATDTGVPLTDPEPTIDYEVSKHEEWRVDNFRRELVYNGRSGDAIKLLYREFVEERIRPAFTQEVTYDLTRGETIGFKGARFQVEDATNVSISYVVLKHLD